MTDISDASLEEARIAHLAAVVDASSDAILSKRWTGRSELGMRAPRGSSATRPRKWSAPNIRLLIPDERQAEEDEILARLRQGDYIEHYETSGSPRTAVRSTCRSRSRRSGTLPAGSPERRRSSATSPRAGRPRRRWPPRMRSSNRSSTSPGSLPASWIPTAASATSMRWRSRRVGTPARRCSACPSGTRRGGAVPTR